MVNIERIWRLSSENLKVNTNIYRWDGGDEIWELDSETGVIHHFRLISRSFLNETQNEMKEVLEPLPESAVSTDIFLQSSLSDMGWSFEEYKEEVTDSSSGDESWEWTPLSHCIPANVLYQQPLPECDYGEQVEWYASEENTP